MGVGWNWCRFGELGPGELYELMGLRQRVFVLEQRCAYVDADGLDPRAWHLLGVEGGRLLASARVFERRPGGEGEASIGRVVVDRGARGVGLGRALVAEAVRGCDRLAPGRAIRIQAQAHLERFYEGFAFRRCTPPYLFDGIVHVDMTRPAG
ncbi:GNAT family N-acetyltransferase [Tautonia plasticadhaerens]|uniref:Putative acyltransferase n=1 Tax=Tautonia plasticadhaerens TaxID=2527974 RepID=A0A518HE40_9BACT|nr:GNAT family N-acetyltransferase [Tautonia plasticadhaerens]QDV38996.1 putative acyltransferase [Tautonia plasticadhaerens]